MRNLIYLIYRYVFFGEYSTIFENKPEEKEEEKPKSRLVRGTYQQLFQPGLAKLYRVEMSDDDQTPVYKELRNPYRRSDSP